MSLLIEDMLTPEESDAISKVLESNEVRLDVLARLAGLDPAIDFRHSNLTRLDLCGSDLRGFDFTGSDLRLCAKDNSTLIDETTIFEGANIEWVEKEALPVIVRMQDVEAATSSAARTVRLKSLVDDFGTTPHVVRYLHGAAERAKSLDAFLDFAEFLPTNLTRDQLKALRPKARELLRRRLAKSKSRTRREGTKQFTIDKIEQRLQRSKGTLAEVIWGHLAEIVTEKSQTLQTRGMAVVDANDLDEALKRLGD